ncbi:MAG: hypothetical protein JXR33_04390 [Coriobacteriia bacterium]|nr:hypothetical protein [Coriobacteriia bacterium]
MLGGIVGTDTTGIWFEIRPINWACSPDVDFSLDALKVYVALVGMGNLTTHGAENDVVVRPYSDEQIAKKVFADDSPKSEKARYLLARRILESIGLVEVAKDGTIAIKTARGLPYRKSVKLGYKAPKEDEAGGSSAEGNERKNIGKFVMLKDGMFLDRGGKRSSRLSVLNPEEVLLLLILFQGARWVFGGVHQEYVSLSPKGSVTFGTLVMDMWNNAIASDESHGCMQEKDIHAVLESLIAEGHLVWGRVLMDKARQAGGMSVSSQRTVVLRDDPRHPSNSNDPSRNPTKLVNVLIPCYGYPSGYQTDLVKLIQRGQLDFEGVDYATTQVFGVTRWKRPEPKTE